MSPFANLRLISSTLASSNERDEITWLCDEAQAPIWLPRGREAKYLTDSAVGIFPAVPLIRTCRPSATQGNSRLTRLLVAICYALALSKLVKNTKPAAS
jgi:hypothetical protein